MAERPVNDNRRPGPFGLSGMLNLVFGVERGAAWARFVLAMIVFILMWVSAALLLHNLASESGLGKVVAVLRGMFCFADTWLFVLAFLLAAYMGREWAATYLADIFEFDDNRITRKYIDRAAFGWGSTSLMERRDDGRDDGREEDRDVVHISGYDIYSEYADATPVETLTKIGGPGEVVVHLESAAVFEKADGTPRVLGPGKRRQHIDGFERLRAVVDLRDHIESFDVKGRTRDGILLTARNVRVLFSVWRGESWQPGDWKSAKDLPRRWEYDPEAILTLVYTQKHRPWHRQMVDGMAKPALRNFIARHTFQELVSNILPTEEAETMHFVFRDEILDVFRNEFYERLKRNGIQLHWVGAGTWEMDANALEEHHLKLWEELLTKRRQVRAIALKKLRFNTCLDTLLSLTQHTLTTSAMPPESVSKEMRVYRVLFDFGQRIRQALMWLRRLEAQDPEKKRECPGLVSERPSRSCAAERGILTVVYRYLVGLVPPPVSREPSRWRPGPPGQDLPPRGPRTGVSP